MIRPRSLGAPIAPWASILLASLLCASSVGCGSSGATSPGALSPAPAHGDAVEAAPREPAAQAEAHALDPSSTPWDPLIQSAIRAMNEQRWADATRHFAEADEALGGFPYDEDAYDDDGRWIHHDDRQLIRDAIQCPWALSLAHDPALVEDQEALRVAMARISSGCSFADRAHFAALVGQLRAAAILAVGLGEGMIPETRELNAWAAIVSRGSFPIAPDLPAAIEWVTAHAQATRSPAARCGAPVRRAARRPDASPRSDDARRYLVDGGDVADDEEDEEDASEGGSAFRFDPRLPLASIVCEVGIPSGPYRDDEGMVFPTAEYLLEQRPEGVQIVGSFEGLPALDCATGFAQADLGQERIAIGGGQSLYVLTRVRGYVSYDEDESSELVRELVVCDPVRLACRPLPTRFVLDAPGPSGGRARRTLRATASFTGGVVRLTGARDLPPTLARFAAGVPLDAFFSEPPIDVTPVYHEWRGDSLDRP